MTSAGLGSHRPSMSLKGILCSHTLSLKQSNAAGGGKGLVARREDELDPLVFQKSWEKAMRAVQTRVSWSVGVNFHSMLSQSNKPAAACPHCGPW